MLRARFPYGATLSLLGALLAHSKVSVSTDVEGAYDTCHQLACYTVITAARP